jgi:hypothetical protein
MIVQRESVLGLYKGASVLCGGEASILHFAVGLTKISGTTGLGAVVSGIVPKMAIRFASFEAYKGYLADKTTGKTSSTGVFLGKFLDSTMLHRKLQKLTCYSA